MCWYHLYSYLMPFTHTLFAENNESSPGSATINAGTGEATKLGYGYVTFEKGLKLRLQ